MARTFEHDSLLINKEAHFYLRQYNRARKGYAPNSEGFLEREWKKIPCKEQNQTLERIDVDTFGISIEGVKKLLTDAGLTYIDDGKKIIGTYL